MFSRTRIAVVLFWLSSLLVVGNVASGQWQGSNEFADPYVLSGDDIGFRVEGLVGQTLAGQLVIRGMDGEWVEPTQSRPVDIRRLQQR